MSDGTVYVIRDIEQSIRILRKWFNDSGLGRELRSRQGYLSRTQRRRVKDARARARMKKRQREFERREGGFN